MLEQANQFTEKKKAFIKGLDPKLPRRYILCLDCKSFFASVESTNRGLHPLTSKLCVVSRADQRSGLVLASSIQMKKHYNVKTGTRTFDIPANLDDILIVPPRMDYYIKVNKKINEIFLRYVAEEDWHPYSIDEGFIDITKSYHLYGTPLELAQEIQQTIWEELHLVMAIGIGDNPLLAKLSLDLDAKYNVPNYISYWQYEDVPDKLWPIENLSDVWGIGSRMTERLAKLKIYTMYDLAHADIDELKKELGIIGEQLYYHAHGIDYSILSEQFKPEHKGFGKSQVLTRDYTNPYEVEIIIQEMTDQVASRLRDNYLFASQLHLSIGYSKSSYQSGFGRQITIDPTNASFKLVPAMLKLFRRYYNGEPVRNIGIQLGHIQPQTDYQLNLFEDPDKLNHQLILEHSIDHIRHQYGYASLVRASSLQPGATAIDRSNLVGGHRG